MTIQPRVAPGSQQTLLFVSCVVDLPPEISHPERWTASIQNGLGSSVIIITSPEPPRENDWKLWLGKREKGLVFARGAGHQGLYQVRSTILDQIPTQTQLLR
jgi:hypothetical protein